MKYLTQATALAFVLAGMLGCTTTLRASVELIEPLAQKDGDEWIDPNPPTSSASLALSLFTAHAAVLELSQHQPTPAATFSGLEASLLNAEREADKRFGSYRELIKSDEVNALINEGEKLKTEVGDPALYERTQKAASNRTLLIVKLKSYLSKASAFQALTNESYETCASGLSDAARSSGSARNCKKMNADFKSNITLANREAFEAGFGGLKDAGIYILSPGDPMYRRVLKGKAVGAISSSKTMVTGDAVVVFFQESPGEIKNFSVNLNSNTLVSNVATLTHKALEAAIKYMSPTGAVTP